MSSDERKEKSRRTDAPTLGRRRSPSTSCATEGEEGVEGPQRAAAHEGELAQGEDECEGAPNGGGAAAGPGGFLFRGGLGDAVAEGRKGAGMAVLLEGAPAAGSGAPLDAVCTERVGAAAKPNAVVGIRLGHGSTGMRHFLSYCPVDRILNSTGSPARRRNAAGDVASTSAPPGRRRRRARS